MPYNAKLEQLCIPQPERVIATVKRALARNAAPQAPDPQSAHT